MIEITASNKLGITYFPKRKFLRAWQSGTQEFKMFFKEFPEENLDIKIIELISISPPRLWELTPLKEVEVICMQGPDHFITEKCSFKKLKNLKIVESRLIDVLFLTKSNSIESLTLKDCDNLSGLSLVDCPNIKSIEMTKNKKMRILKGSSLPKTLKILNFHDTNFEEVSDIEYLSELQELTLMCELYSPVYTGVSDWKSCKNLNKLSLNFFIDGKNRKDLLRILPSFSELEHLTIKNSYIKDVEFLAELKGLKTLCLSENLITDISVLKELPNLEVIDFNSCYISDISVLKELPKLYYGDLSNNYIRDTSVLEEISGRICLNSNPI